MVQYNYNGLSKSGGIYVIFNSYNWRIYIGSTKQFFKRWKDGHVRTLLSGRHSNRFLLADFNKCKNLLGHDDFLEFHIIKNMPSSTKEERLSEEEVLLKLHFDQGKNCYNLCSRVISREGCYNKQQCKGIRDENTGKIIRYIKKIKQYHTPWNKGKVNCYSEETIKAMGSGRRGKNTSKETKEKMTKSHKGKFHSLETKEKISETKKGIKNPNFKKPMSDKCRYALLKSNIGRIPTKATIDAIISSHVKTHDIVLLDPSGNKHGPIINLAKFCREHNLESSIIYKLIKGQRTHHKNWTLKTNDI